MYAAARIYKREIVNAVRQTSSTQILATRRSQDQYRFHYKKWTEMPRIDSVREYKLALPHGSGRPPPVVLVCVCVCGCFGGSVTVPTPAMDTVLFNTKLNGVCRLCFVLTQLFAKVIIVTLTPTVQYSECFLQLNMLYLKCLTN